MRTKKVLLVLLVIFIIIIGSNYEYQCQLEDEKAEKELLEVFQEVDTIVKKDTLIHYHDGLSDGPNS